MLSGWLLPQDQIPPLAFGLADTHNFRWPVAIRPPPPDAPQGWWLQFTETWRAYLATQLHPLQAAPLPIPMEDSSRSTVAARRPRPKPTAGSSARRAAPRRPQPSPDTTSNVQPPASAEPPRKRQATLAAWRRPAPVPPVDDTAPPSHGGTFTRPPCTSWPGNRGASNLTSVDRGAEQAAS